MGGKIQNIFVTICFPCLGVSSSRNSLSGLGKLQWRKVDNKVQEGCFWALLGGPGKAIDGKTHCLQLGPRYFYAAINVHLPGNILFHYFTWHFKWSFFFLPLIYSG